FISLLQALQLLHQPFADLVDVLARRLAVGLARRLAVHLQQLQAEVVGIIHHPLLAAVAPLDDLLGPVERPGEQHQLEPLVSAPDRLQPARPERRVHLAPAIGDRHRHAAPAAGFADVARLGERAQELRGLGVRPVAPGLLLELRLAGGDEGHRLLACHSLPPLQRNRAEPPLGWPARLAILHCARRVPNQRDAVNSYFAYLVQQSPDWNRMNRRALVGHPLLTQEVRMTLLRVAALAALPLALSAPIAAQPAPQGSAQTILVWSFGFSPHPIQLAAG